MEEQRDALERILAGKLSDYTPQPPPPELFERIVASTAQARAEGPVRGIRIVRRHRRSMAGVRMAVAVAALFALGMFVTLRQATRIDHTMQQTTLTCLAEIDPLTELPDVGAGEYASATPPHSVPHTDLPRSAASVPRHSALRTCIDPTAGTGAVPVLHAANKTVPAAEDTGSVGAGFVSDLQGATLTQEAASFEEPVAKDPANPSSVSVSGAATQEPVPGEGARVQQRWERIMAQNRLPKRRARAEWAASLYTSNFGVGDAEAVYTGIRGTGMLAVSHPGGNHVIPDGNQGMIMSAPIRDRELITFDHRVPVTFGIDVSYPIGPRFSLESGLSYTFLRSDSRQDRDFAYTLRQDLHYLGIPLSVAWSFTGRRPLDVYVRGGGMIEKSIYATRTKVYTGPHAVGRERERIYVKGVQFSLHAALGVSYTFGNRLGIYFEPGAAYYMEKSSQPLSYRTEHPVSLSLRAGVRIMLK